MKYRTTSLASTWISFFVAALVLGSLLVGFTLKTTAAEGMRLVTWGARRIPTGLTNVEAVSARWDHCLVLLTTGTALRLTNTALQTLPPPADLPKLKAVAAGCRHDLGLTEGGSVIGWGDNEYGETIPPRGLSNVVAISAGHQSSLALTKSGQVFSWGRTEDDTRQVVGPPTGLSNVVAIASGWFHHLALRRDGTIVAWGSGKVNNGAMAQRGQCVVPSAATNIVAIAAGGAHSMALDRNGKVFVWGRAGGEPLAESMLRQLGKVVAIACGDSHCLAVKEDGSVVEWGVPTDLWWTKDGALESKKEWETPRELRKVCAVAAGRDFSVALVRE